MDFWSQHILTLADPAGAEGVLGAEQAMSVLTAAFELRAVDVASVDLVRVLRTSVLSMTPTTSAGDLQARPADGGAGWQASLTMRGHEVGTTADAEVRLRLTTSARAAMTTVTDVRTATLTDALSLHAVDQRIVADDGGLPDPPDALEERRREALFALLMEGFARPDDWDADDFWSRPGHRSVAEVIARYGAPRIALATALDLQIDPDPAPRSLDFTLDLAVLVEPAPFEDLPALLHRVRRVRACGAGAAAQPEPPAGALLRHPVPLAVVCPQAAFDDDDLPVAAGATPATDPQRRAARVSAVNDRLRLDAVAFVPV